MNKILSVSQLNNYLKSVFDDELLIQNITVEGEVFECKFSGGNTYITLKEGEYSLYCVKFASRAEFAVGDKVRAYGSMRYYPKGGKATFVALNFSASGKGELLIKLNELKERLQKEGIFNNKKTLPRIIKKIAIVTSVEGAVIHDFMEVLARNGCSYIDVDVYGVKVQGIGAERTIETAIKRSAAQSYDVLVVARGGGSSTDLSCFNTEAVARCVYDCPFPTISAVGHQIDYTLCDYSASVRAGTPSIAAELIVRNNEAFFARFLRLLELLRAGTEAKLDRAFIRARARFNEILLGCEKNVTLIKEKLLNCDNEMFNRLSERISTQHSAVKLNSARLKSGVENSLVKAENEIKLASAVLDRLSPLKIISDGYAKVFSYNRGVKSVSEVSVGDVIKILLKDGVLDAEVKEKGGINGFGK